MKKIKIYEEFINNELLTKFKYLKKMWCDETSFYSDPASIYNNKYYLEIISLGINILPILINDLNTKDGDWFDALYKITNIDPVKKENIGNVSNMIVDWVKWYKENYG